MIHNEYSLDPLLQYLKDNPNAKNPELYSICNAKNNSQKSGVRRKKQTILKRRFGTDSSDEITSLTPESIEKLIKDKLNRKSNIPDTQIRMALDFLIKLKVTDTMEEDFDMEALKEIGIISKT